MFRPSLTRGLLLSVLVLAASRGAVSAQEVTFTAEVDNNKIGLSDTVDLTVTIAGSGLNQAINPVVPDLVDFDIVGQSSSTNMTFVNGKLSSSRSIIYTLAPKKMGKLTIPAVSLSYADKQYATEPVEVEVVAESTAPKKRRQDPWSPFFDPFETRQTRQHYGPEAVQLVAELDRRQVYQGEQATLSLKILTQISITGLAIEEFPPLTGFWVEEVEVEKNPKGRKVTVGDREYTEFLIKRNALFPSRPGKFAIGPATLAIEVAGVGFLGGGERVKRQSRPLSIEVLPLPESGRPAGFDGTVGTFSIAATIDREELAVGDVATMKVTVTGKGNIKTVNEPVFAKIEDLRFYEPKFTEKLSFSAARMQGEKSWEYVLSPKTKGDHQIAPIRLAYFDPSTKSYKVAETKPLTIHAEAAEGIQQPVVIGERAQLRALRQDISFIRSTNRGIPASSSRSASSPAFWLLLLIPPIVNLVLLGYRRTHENRQTDMASYLRGQAYSQFKKSLRKARGLANPAQAKEFYQHLNDTLARYAAHKLSMSPQGLTLHTVLMRLEERGLDQELRSKLESIWNDAELGLFAAIKPGVNSMEALLRETESTIAAVDRVI